MALLCMQEAASVRTGEARPAYSKIAKQRFAVSYQCKFPAIQKLMEFFCSKNDG